MHNRYFIYHLTPSTRPGKKWDKKPLLREGFTVSDFDSCEVALSRLGNNQALGLYFTEDMRKFFYDLDGCRDADTGELNAIAQEAVQLFVGAYIEISVSGTGIHIVGSYSGPRPNHSCRNDDLGIEMYTAGRGMAMGTPIPSSGSMDMDCTGAFLRVLEQHFKPKDDSGPIEWRDGHELGWLLPDDDELINIAIAFTPKAKHAFGSKATFADLWTRNVSKLSKAFVDNVSGRDFDESAADLALMSWLAFLTGNDCTRMLQLAWKSGLVRDKWEKHKTYLQRTITRSLVKDGEFYKLKGSPPPKATPEQIKQLRGKVELKQFKGIKMEHITWLWDQWLPRGKLTIYAGPGGVGKSTVAFNLAAIISCGSEWPDGTKPAGPEDVLIWSAEDDPSDTIAPRLTAMGADMNRVHLIGASTDEAGNVLPFDPASDIPSLREQIAEEGLKVALIIIDPIVNAVAGDMNKANDVRRALSAIVEMASDLNCCVIGITHFTKGSGGKNPTERVIGSQAFTAYARMSIAGQKDEETGDCVVIRTKSNISIDQGGFKYRIEPTVISGGFSTTKVNWLGAIEGSARQILNDLEPGEEKVSERKVDAAREFLKIALSQQPLPLKQLTEQGGFSKATLMRAKEQLPIRIERDGNKCIWSMPFGEMPEA